MLGSREYRLDRNGAKWSLTDHVTSGSRAPSAVVRMETDGWMSPGTARATRCAACKDLTVTSMSFPWNFAFQGARRIGPALADFVSRRTDRVILTRPCWATVSVPRPICYTETDSPRSPHPLRRPMPTRGKAWWPFTTDLDNRRTRFSRIC